MVTNIRWKRHGELVEGDFVFSPSGKPTKVIATSKSDFADIEVEFFDGSVIKCHRNHEWTVFDRGAKGPKWKTYETNYFTQVKTTSTSGGKTRARFQIPVTKCLEYPEKSLPIHPYFLGMWLGDGKSCEPQITHHIEDYQSIEKIEAVCGYSRPSAWQHSTTGVVHTSFAGNGIRKVLGKLKLLNNKHIPEEYLLSSKEQRLELLAGLLS